jgi:hypothetical protein
VEVAEEDGLRLRGGEGLGPHAFERADGGGALALRPRGAPALDEEVGCQGPGPPGGWDVGEEGGDGRVVPGGGLGQAEGGLDGPGVGPGQGEHLAVAGRHAGPAGARGDGEPARLEQARAEAEAMRIVVVAREQQRPHAEPAHDPRERLVEEGEGRARGREGVEDVAGDDEEVGPGLLRRRHEGVHRGRLVVQARGPAQGAAEMEVGGVEKPHAEVLRESIGDGAGIGRLGPECLAGLQPKQRSGPRSPAFRAAVRPTCQTSPAPREQPAEPRAAGRSQAPLPLFRL